MGDICKIWENEDRLLTTHSFSNSSLTFLPLDALLIEEVQLPLSDEFFLSAIVVGGGGAAFFFRLRPRVVYDMMKGLEFINEYKKNTLLYYKRIQEKCLFKICGIFDIVLAYFL